MLLMCVQVEALVARRQGTVSSPFLWLWLLISESLRTGGESGVGVGGGAGVGGVVVKVLGRRWRR